MMALLRFACLSATSFVSLTEQSYTKKVCIQVILELLALIDNKGSFSN